MTTAHELMTRFVARTGVTGTARPRRYLWTDAFAVCNLLRLGNEALARTLIERVHRELGRHRRDDTRRGWISGLSEQDGEKHPTLGGLRIGKRLPERTPDERIDERLEWDRDGQYFHYLTRWMMALARYSYAAHRPEALIWARELAAVAQLKFTVGNRMVWKMSIDLSRPQVPSMGQHDPIDGVITLLELDAITTRTRGPRTPPLDAATRALYVMIDPGALATTDPLGLGGLLLDAYRASCVDAGRELVPVMLRDALTGLAAYARSSELAQPAARRLAFRELGLAIGLSAMQRLGHEGLTPYMPLREQIVAFWRHAPHRELRTWTDHQDINDVMLATALEPSGVIG